MEQSSLFDPNSRTKILTFVEFAARRKLFLPFIPEEYSTPDLYGRLSNQQIREVERRIKEETEAFHVAFKKVKEEWDAEVASGGVREPQLREKTVRKARGADERDDVEAARRLCLKYGIDYTSPQWDYLFADYVDRGQVESQSRQAEPRGKSPETILPKSPNRRKEARRKAAVKRGMLPEKTLANQE